MLYPRFRKLRVRAQSRLAPNFSDDLTTKPVTQRYWKATCDVTAGVVRNEGAWRRLINAYVDLHAEVDRHLEHGAGQPGGVQLSAEHPGGLDV
jgi:hypothetical protein